MDPERWQRINELFHAALEQEPDARGAFLRAACGDDSELLAEVESLLSSHSQADEFIEVPAYESAADLLEVEADESLVGQRLGPYEVMEKIGQGGMGVVYLAEDTRLGRTVAIKALPSNLTCDERSRERLRREARAAATVSHPGIATVHSLEEVDDHLYIVYEHVQGPTLREEMADGPLPSGRLAPPALAIARAVGAAHEQGIIHRDLKPENVIRTPDGGIKVLDLGLAAFENNPLPTGSSGFRLTIPGMLLGTPAYMSPEQLRGEDVDHRADIFAFGVLVYELAAGTHPFAQEDPASTIASILELEPADLHEEVPEIAPELSRIVMLCLRKDRAERYERTADLVADLEQLELGNGEVGHGSGPVVTGRPEMRVNPATAPPFSPTPSAGIVSPPRYSPLWWWRFHQIVVGIGYYAMLVPLWLVKKWTEGGESAAWGSAMFFIALVPVGVAGILRIHLWFTSRYYPTELLQQRSRAAVWIHSADALFVVLLLSGAYLIAIEHASVATLLVAFAIGYLIVATMIEPTTSRAAFREEGGSGSR